MTSTKPISPTRDSSEDHLNLDSVGSGLIGAISRAEEMFSGDTRPDRTTLNNLRSQLQPSNYKEFKAFSREVQFNCYRVLGVVFELLGRENGARQAFTNASRLAKGDRSFEVAIAVDRLRLATWGMAKIDHDKFLERAGKLNSLLGATTYSFDSEPIKNARQLLQQTLIKEVEKNRARFENYFEDVKSHYGPSALRHLVPLLNQYRQFKIRMNHFVGVGAQVDQSTLGGYERECAGLILGALEKTLMSGSQQGLEYGHIASAKRLVKRLMLELAVAFGGEWKTKYPELFGMARRFIAEAPGIQSVSRVNQNLVEQEPAPPAKPVVRPPNYFGRDFDPDFTL